MKTCPRDGEALLPRDRADIHADWCPACHGFAVHERDLRALAATWKAGRRFPMSAEPPRVTHPPGARVPECPCGDPLPMQGAPRGAVRLSRCSGCRTVWLDHGWAGGVRGLPVVAAASQAGSGSLLEGTWELLRDWLREMDDDRPQGFARSHDASDRHGVARLPDGPDVPDADGD